jgi:hypothetical protein
MSADGGPPDFRTLAELVDLGFRVYELPATYYRDLRGRPVWDLEEVDNERMMMRLINDWLGR